MERAISGAERLASVRSKYLALPERDAAFRGGLADARAKLEALALKRDASDKQRAAEAHATALRHEREAARRLQDELATTEAARAREESRSRELATALAAAQARAASLEADGAAKEVEIQALREDAVVGEAARMALERSVAERESGLLQAEAVVMAGSKLRHATRDGLAQVLQGAIAELMPVNGFEMLHFAPGRNETAPIGGGQALDNEHPAHLAAVMNRTLVSEDGKRATERNTGRCRYLYLPVRFAEEQGAVLSLFDKSDGTVFTAADQRVLEIFAQTFLRGFLTDVFARYAIEASASQLEAAVELVARDAPAAVKVSTAAKQRRIRDMNSAEKALAGMLSATSVKLDSSPNEPGLCVQVIRPAALQIAERVCLERIVGPVIARLGKDTIARPGSPTSAQQQQAQQQAQQRQQSKILSPPASLVSPGVAFLDAPNQQQVQRTQQELAPVTRTLARKKESHSPVADDARRGVSPVLEDRLGGGAVSKSNTNLCRSDGAGQEVEAKAELEEEAKLEMNSSHGSHLSVDDDGLQVIHEPAAASCAPAPTPVAPVYDIARHVLVSAVKGRDALVECIISRACAMIGCEATWISLRSRHAGPDQVQLLSPRLPANEEPVMLSAAGGIEGMVLLGGGRPVVANDLQHDTLINTAATEALKLDADCAVGVPIRDALSGAVQGVFVAVNKASGAFSQEDVSVLERFAGVYLGPLMGMLDRAEESEESAWRLEQMHESLARSLRGWEAAAEDVSVLLGAAAVATDPDSLVLAVTQARAVEQEERAQLAEKVATAPRPRSPASICSPISIRSLGSPRSFGSASGSPASSRSVARRRDAACSPVSSGLEQRLAETETALEEESARHERARAELRDCLERLGRAESEAQRLDAVQRECEAERTRANELQKSVDTLRVRAESRKVACAAARDACRVAEEELNRLRARVAELEAESTAIKAKHKAAEEAANVVREERDYVVWERDQSAAALEALKLEHDRLASDEAALRNERNALAAQGDDLRTERAALESERDHLASQCRHLEAEQVAASEARSAMERKLKASAAKARRAQQGAKSLQELADGAKAEAESARTKASKDVEAARWESEEAEARLEAAMAALDRAHDRAKRYKARERAAIEQLATVRGELETVRRERTELTNEMLLRQNERTQLRQQVETAHDAQQRAERELEAARLQHALDEQLRAARKRRPRGEAGKAHEGPVVRLDAAGGLSLDIGGGGGGGRKGSGGTQVQVTRSLKRGSGGRAPRRNFV